MAWTTPRTWATAELVTAALLNTHIRDNLNILAAPNKTVVRYLKTSDYALTGAGYTSFADVDATNLAGSITLTSATRILFTVHVEANYYPVSGTYGAIDVLVDGTTRTGNTTHGIITVKNTDNNTAISGTGLITGLSAGAHTFKLQAKVSNAADTLTIYSTVHCITIIAEEV